MKTITLHELLSSLPESRGIAYGEDFFLIDQSYKRGDSIVLAYPCKFDGIICMYCISGEFKLSIGLDEYPVHTDGFAISLPGDIISLEKVSNETPGKIRLLGVSGSLLKEMDFNIPKAETIFRYRMVQANYRYKILIHNFRNIFRSIISDCHQETSRSLAYMLRAMSIEIENIWANLAYAPRSKTKNGGGRLTDTFVELVAKNHIRHREIEFYADHLGLTSKYLSTTIKKESGKSAAEWIVSYVLLEAKYYLRQTNSPIKQIAFELNFANQMDFYRYFLRHTGMTPSEYRNLPGC